jgi:hypothetical protein
MYVGDTLCIDPLHKTMREVSGLIKSFDHPNVHCLEK